MQYVIYVLILLALIIIVRNIRVVQQSKVMIIERLGKYQSMSRSPSLKESQRPSPSRSRSRTFRLSPLSPRITSPCRSTPLSTSR